MFGGLGAIINDSEVGLKFSRNQLMFPKVSEKALYDAVFEDLAYNKPEKNKI